jgi:membrane protein implicated in regulation of membrane protease activity
MTPHMKFGIAGVVIGLILLIVLPWWASVILIALAIGIPVTAYAMLDPSQRRRLKENRRRRQLGS